MQKARYTKDFLGSPVVRSPCFHFLESERESESCSVMSDSLQPHGLYSPQNSPAQNTGVDSLSLLQGIFLTQELTGVSSIAGEFFTNWAIRKASLPGGPGSIPAQWTKVLQARRWGQK